MAAPKKRWIVMEDNGTFDVVVLSSREAVKDYLESQITNGSNVDFVVHEVGKKVSFDVERNVTVTVGK